MPNITINKGDYRREVALEPLVIHKNRFIEENPVLTDGEIASIARPALRKWLEIGDGPVRKLYNAPGAFAGDLFGASGLDLWRITKAGVTSNLGQISTNALSTVSMAATGNIEDIPEYLFVCDGAILWVYTENRSALGHLEVTGFIANNDVVQIGGIYYKFTNAGVDVGTPDGSNANPWLVNFAGTNAAALTALFNAINDQGEAGVDYSTALTPHPTVDATASTSADLYVLAKTPGAGGNAISTTETGAGMAWTAATLQQGGTAGMQQVLVPGDVGAISVAVINSFVIVVPAQGFGVNGRFYWIEPGEIFIDPLNFATAERSPDAVNEVVVFSNLFWLFGQDTTEPWLTTSDPAAPFQRMEGVLYDRGSWEGTAVRVNDQLVVVDGTGVPMRIQGGSEPIGRPDVVERIRKAIQTLKSFPAF